MSPMAAEPAGEYVPAPPPVTKTVWRNGSNAREVSESTTVKLPERPLGEELAGLYAERVAAKIWNVAVEYSQGENIERFPEHVPTEGVEAGRYATREARFWTCGFFPGSLWTILERCVRYPRTLPVPAGIDRGAFHAQLLRLCRTWAEPLLPMAHRTNTHDMGFITQPALRMAWELTGDGRAREALVTAAYSLATRFDDRLQAVRSWDQSVSRRYEITDQTRNFLVIVDSMCNLDLLFYVGHHTGDARLVEIGKAHARFVAKHLVRADASTWHVVNLDPGSGRVQTKYTHQGWADDSTWARGQAWALLGFAQTYMWTRAPEFLSVALRVANHFVARLQQVTHAYPFVAAWDFDAPLAAGRAVQRDSSAAMIAANGLLVLHAALQHRSPYLGHAVRIAREVCQMALVPDGARLVVQKGAGNGMVSGSEEGEEGTEVVAQNVAFDAILTHATANNNPHALVRYGDHGLVYADYYFVEFGNKLLRMGLV